jgi:hypothetical protein
MGPIAISKYPDIVIVVVVVGVALLRVPKLLSTFYSSIFNLIAIINHSHININVRPSV